MTPLPIQLNPDHRTALIAGGLACATDVVRTLRRAGWSIRILAPELCPSLRPYQADDGLVWETHEPGLEDVEQAKLVFAASDSSEANQRTAKLAAQSGRLFCDLTTGDGDFQLDCPSALRTNRDNPWATAQVCLVGAGPGDPGLLTLDGEQALTTADVVLYDRLVSDAVMACIPADIEQIFVGKRRNHHYYTQDQLNALMVERARAGQRVVRLKGGDPFMFGRGGEETTALMAAGITTCAMPGISAGSGCATYADIPLTHRDHASTCQFLTAHVRDGEAEYDWEALVRTQHTLVVYMGVSALRNLCPRLIENGMSPDMPAALIERGTTPEQRVMTGTVTTLPRIAEQQQLHSPAVLIIGGVVTLHEQINQQRNQQETNTSVEA